MNRLSSAAGPATRPSTAQKLACLDGLRGIAILLVILFHFHEIGPRALHPVLHAALAPFAFGYSGVHLFLVLSGFCLTHSLIARAASGRAPGLRSYLLARWWRIAPPYYVATAVYLAVPAALLLLGHVSRTAEILSLRQVVSHLLFLHGLWPDTIYAINTPFWSLSLEFQFYLAFPLLFALGVRFGIIPVIVLVAALSLAWRAGLAGFLAEPQDVFNGLFLGRWTEFAFGMGVAWWYNRNDRGRSEHLPWAAAAPAFLALAVVASARGHELTTDFLYGIGYASLLAATLRSSERGGRLARAFSVPLLVATGVGSYSLYLTHTLFMERGVQVYWRLLPRTTLWTDLAMLAAVSGVIGVAGWAFHHLVERRFLSARGAKRRRETTGPPTPRRLDAAVTVASS